MSDKHDDAIRAVPQIKELLSQGWELWYIADPQGPLPGHWEMRYRSKSLRVHWDAIVKIQRAPNWFHQHTDETEVGRDWCYRTKQGNLQISVRTH